MQMMHMIEFRIEWSLGTPPEHFKHRYDLYYRWRVHANPQWLERGIMNLLCIPERANVLELCCGDGFNTKYFYSVRANKIVAIDFDFNAISHAKRHYSGKNITFMHKDIRKELPKSIFDTVVMDMAIEHFTFEEAIKILGNIKDRLTAGGVFCGVTIVGKAEGGENFEHHENEFSSKEDLMLFLKPHFKNVKVFETEYPKRHNLYFWASDGILPFDAKWDAIVVNV